MSDPAIDRKQAFQYLKLHMDKDAQRFNKTILNTPISQPEYDLYLFLPCSTALVPGLIVNASPFKSA